MFLHFVFVKMYHLGFEALALLFVWIFFFHGLIPKSGIKNSVKALLFEIAECYENYFKSLMSPSLPSILLFLVIMQAVILENFALFILLSLF